jgi:MFS family permease
VKLLRTVLGNRDLARVELALASSSLGNWAFSILLALYAYRAGGTSAVALALVARMVPAGLAAPYAAMLADRHSRRSLLLWSAVARAAALACAAAAAGAGAPLAVVIAFSVVYAVAATTHRPAQAALMPQLARSPAELAAANVTWNAIDYAGFLLGSLAAGAIAATAGLGAGFAVCAAALTLTALTVATLPHDARPAAPEAAPGGLVELTEGLRTVRAQPEMGLIVGLFTANALIQGVLDVLVVVAAIELLGLGEQGAGWLNAAWGAGGVVAVAAALSLLRRGRLAAGLSAGFAVAGGSVLLIALLASAEAAFPLFVLMGVGLALVESSLLTLTQRLAPDDVLARVFGVEEAIEVLGIGLGSVLAAVLAGVLGIQGALIATGAVALPVAVVAALRLARTGAGARVSERSYGLVRALPLFSPLPVATLENLVLRLERRAYEPGQTIVLQGEVGDAFYVIDDGEVEVAVDGVMRRRQGPGEFFGEIALLRDVPRTATITATGRVTALAIDREAFLGAIGAHPRSSGAAEAAARERLAAAARPA